MAVSEVLGVYNGWDVIGFIGGCLLAVSLAPQIIHTLKTRRAEDISLFWQLIYMSGLSSFLAYAIHYNLAPAYIPALLELAGIFTVTVLKLLFDYILPAWRRFKAADQPEQTVKTDQTAKEEADKDADLKDLESARPDPDRGTQTATASPIVSTFASTVSPRPADSSSEFSSPIAQLSQSPNNANASSRDYVAMTLPPAATLNVPQPSG